MSKGRLLVLANPAASRCEQSLDAALGALFRSGFDLDVRRTADRGDLDRIIREAGGGAHAIVIGGGDGTLNGAAAALIACGRPVAILPLGTANDLALTLGIPIDPVAAAGLIAGGHRRRIDVGMVNDVHFLNVASVGLSVAIAERQDPELKKRWNIFSYLIAAVGALTDAERFPATIVCDGIEKRVEAYQIAIGNGVHYGGGLKIAEDAAIDDGLLDVCAIETQTLADLVVAAPGLTDGRVGQRDDVTMLRGRVVRIETDRPMPVNTDGEVTTETPAEFTVHPGALEVFVPVPASAD